MANLLSVIARNSDPPFLCHSKRCLCSSWDFCCVSKTMSLTQVYPRPSTWLPTVTSINTPNLWAINYVFNFRYFGSNMSSSISDLERCTCKAPFLKVPFWKLERLWGNPTATEGSPAEVSGALPLLGEKPTIKHALLCSTTRHKETRTSAHIIHTTCIWVWREHDANRPDCCTRQGCPWMHSRVNE